MSAMDKPHLPQEGSAPVFLKELLNTNYSTEQHLLLLFDDVVVALESVVVSPSADQLSHNAEVLNEAIEGLSRLRASVYNPSEEHLPYDVERLYIYMQYRLIDAHSKKDFDAINEVKELINVLKSGWKTVSQQLNFDK